MTYENVTPLTGDQPDSTHHPNLQANVAMDAAIAEIERLQGDGRVVAQLIEAREAIRAEYRRQRKAGASESDTAIADRVRRVFGKHCWMLGDYLLRGDGWEDCTLAALEDAWAIAEVLSTLDVKNDHLTDRAVPELAFLQTRILDLARAVRSAEYDRQAEAGSDA
jgi:hypothetical protein